jgi:hypothetical protein
LTRYKGVLSLAKEGGAAPEQLKYGGRIRVRISYTLRLLLVRVYVFGESRLSKTDFENDMELFVTREMQ